MSTEAKKEKALSSEEMSGVAGGGNANSKDGTPGGGEFLVGKAAEKLSDEEMSGILGGSNKSSNGTSGGPEFLIDPNDQIKQTSVYVV